MRARARDFAWNLYVRPKGRLGNAVQSAAILGAERVRTRRAWSRAERVFLVHTPGKVGSKAVAAAIEPMLGEADCIFHTHRLNASYLRESMPKRTGVAPRRTWATVDFLSEVLKRPHDKQILVLAAVRDPVERNLSAFFQNLERYTEDGLPPRPGQLDAEELAVRFLERFDHREYLRWYDEELGGVFGIDVLSEPFPFEDGYQVFRSPGQSVGVIRHDRLDELPKFIRDLCGLETGPLRRVNDSSDKGYGAVYSEVRRSLVLPERLVTDLYSSRAMRHFYSEDERRKAMSRWM